MSQLSLPKEPRLKEELRQIYLDIEGVLEESTGKDVRIMST